MAADAPTDASLKSPPLAQTYRKGTGKWVLFLLGAYVVQILWCSVWLSHSRDVMVSGGEMTYDRALFLSISTATLTGFQQSIGFNDFNFDSAQGPAIVLLLTIAGSLFTLIAGGLAATRILRLPFTDLQVVTAALTAELLAILTGGAALLTGGMSVVDALHRSACAFGNSGAVIIAHGHPFPAYSSFATQAVLLPLSICGGLGLPVLMEFYYRLVGGVPRLSTHTRSTIKMTAGVYVIATTVLFFAALAHGEPTPADAPTTTPDTLVSPDHHAAGQVRAAFLVASTSAINTRTAGLPFEIINRFARPAQWILVILMMIGASSAGTGGGIKLSSLCQLVIGFRDVLRGRPVRRAFGIAGAWVGAYLTVAALSFFLLSIMEPQIPADRLFFLTISALSNVGLSHDPISIVGPGLFMLALVMLAGRLMPIAILWWMAKTTTDADVLVG